MINFRTLQSAFDFVAGRLHGMTFRSSAILGSGWNEVLDQLRIIESIPYSEIPGLGSTSVAGHAGRITVLEQGDNRILAFQGRRHYYETADWTPVAIPIYLAQQLSVPKLLLTNAAGSLAKSLQPGSVMVITDHINHMGSNPLIGPVVPAFGTRFPDLSRVYDAQLQDQLKAALRTTSLQVASGVYLAVSGPTYETPAEIQLFAKLGAHAVGMSTVPEAILAHAAGIKVAGLSCITNFGAGLSPHDLSHEEVKETAGSILPQLTKALEIFWKEESRNAA